MTTVTDETTQVQDQAAQDETVEVSAPEIEFGIDVKKLKAGEYIATVGRRKTATAQVRMSVADKKTAITVNDMALEEYFPTAELQKTVRAPFHKLKYPHSFTITVVVKGGGKSGQAEAVRHGIARALIEYDPVTRGQLKRLGYLKRDPRSKERKKPGLKKARKSSQWSKR